jgi:hypothetical protein
MKVEELLGSKVWIKTDQFRSVPGKIVSTSGSRCLLETSLRSSVPIFQRLNMPTTRNPDPAETSPDPHDHALIAVGQLIPGFFW